MTSKLMITSRPITPDTGSYIMLEHEGGLIRHALISGYPVALSVDSTTKYCTGWYDIAAHTNYPCKSRMKIKRSYDACFACRQKTGFNPAFYNTSRISDKQAAYNDMPHTVYIAYFGGGITKAGIMSDSRGRERLYEQGALLYTIVSSCPNAAIAHQLEDRLISRGLKNSVTKKQKAAIYESAVDIKYEMASFRTLLDELGYDDAEIVSNLDLFFFGAYPQQPIELFGDRLVSGNIVGLVGRYLALENNGRCYGVWLSDMFGYDVEIGEEITLISREPEQTSLF